MRIKDYMCKCGHNDFFFADKGSQKGIYCSYCGKWFKRADKDEQNLAIKQEPVLNYWHTEPPKKNGRYLIWWGTRIDIANYTDNLYEVDKIGFWDRKRAGWYDYDSNCGYYEAVNVKAWQELPSDYKE